VNSIVVLIIGFIVAFLGYRVYAKYIDSKIVQSDPKRATPAKMYMDGVDFMPTGKSILFGYQFKSIAGAAPIIGPIIAVQWGWLPALIWILAGAFFIGWVHDYSSAMIAMRHEGASFGGLSYKLISPRARTILLSFIYFYLLLIAGAFGNVVMSTAIGLKGSPIAWAFMTVAGILAGQMIYRWRSDIILTTVICVAIILVGIGVGTATPTDKIIGASLANSRFLWAVLAFFFCYFGAVLPIWRFALPINYVASYIVFLGLLFGIIGIFVRHPAISLPAFTGFTIKIGPLWPIMFVTIACGAVSGWHSLVSSSGTARQLENELDARPVGGGVMFVEMMLAVFALIIAATFATPSAYSAAVAKGPGAVFAGGVANFLAALGLPLKIGVTYGSVMMIILAVTILQLVVRFMRVATSELLGDFSPIFKNANVGTLIASILGVIVVITGWYQYLWVLFGGANQLMASLALMMVTAWMISEGKKYFWSFYPMIFMFVTTVAALLYTSYGLLSKVFTGGVKGIEALVGNTLMGVVGFFLVIAAIILAVDGLKAFKRHRVTRAAAAAPAKA
jgi:carbon starvation protein